MENRVRIKWVPTPDLEIEGFYGYDEPQQTEATNQLIEKLESGEWVCEDAIAYVTCASCGKESIGASLHWIVVDADDEHGYKQTVEAELRAEALENEKAGALQ